MQFFLCLRKAWVLLFVQCFCCYLIQSGSRRKPQIFEVHIRAQSVGLLWLCFIWLSRQRGNVDSLTKQLYFIDRYSYEVILHLN